MAQDPRYRSRGVSLENTRPLDFASVRESFQASQSLQKRLDRVTDIAFSELKTKAEREGKMYAVQNPISLQQIQDAIGSGTPLESLIQDSDTVFGASAAAAQATLLRQDLLNDFTLKLQELNSGIDSNMVTDVDSVIVDVNANIDGYANVLSQIDPESSINFRASAATIGAATVKKALDAAEARNMAENEVKSQNQLNFFKQYWASTLRTDSDALSKLAFLKEREVNSFAVFRRNPKTFSDNVAKFNAEVDSGIQDELANHLIESKTISKFYNGERGEWGMILAARGLDTPDNIQKIIKIATDKIDQQGTLMKAERDAQYNLKQETFIDLYDKFTSQVYSGEEFKNELKAINYPLSVELLKEINNEKASSLIQNENFSDLSLQVQLGKMDYGSIDNKAYAGDISYFQAADLKKQYLQVTKTLKAGNDIINNRLRIDDLTVMRMNQDNPLRTLIADARFELSLAQSRAVGNGEEFDQRTAAIEIAEKTAQKYKELALPKHISTVSRHLKKTDYQFTTGEAFAELTDAEILSLKYKGKDLAPRTYERLMKNRNTLKDIYEGQIVMEMPNE